MSLRLGMVVPSSNTVVEPMTARLLQDQNEVAMYAARVRVTRIGVDGEASAQFAPEAYQQAGRLLRDARVDVVVWNGTSGAWLGRPADDAIRSALSDAARAPATSSTLAYHHLLEQRGYRRLALWTPYVASVQHAIIAGWQDRGLQVVAEQHLGIQENHVFATIEPQLLEEGLRRLLAQAPQAVVVLCTNVAAAHLAARLEAELGVPVLDSVAVTLWHALKLAGADPSQVVDPQRWAGPFRT